MYIFQGTHEGIIFLDFPKQSLDLNFFRHRHPPCIYVATALYPTSTHSYMGKKIFYKSVPTKKLPTSDSTIPQISIQFMYIPTHDLRSVFFCLIFTPKSNSSRILSIFSKAGDLYDWSNRFPESNLWGSSRGPVQGVS